MNMATHVAAACTALQRQPAGPGQASLQHLLYSSGGSTPSHQQGSSSINDLQPRTSSSLPAQRSDQAARALQPSQCISHSQQDARDLYMLAAIPDLEAAGRWLDEHGDWHQTVPEPGAHGSHAADDPLLDLFPSHTPEATGGLPSPLPRPFSTLPLLSPHAPDGREIFDLHPSLSSPVIRLPGSDVPEAEGNLAGSRSMMQLDMLHELQAPVPDDLLLQAQAFPEPPALTQGPQRRGMRMQHRVYTHAPRQGLVRTTSAPVMRRNAAASRQQSHPAEDLHTQTDGFDFSIECGPRPWPSIACTRPGLLSIHWPSLSTVYKILPRAN